MRGKKINRSEFRGIRITTKSHSKVRKKMGILMKKDLKDLARNPDFNIIQHREAIELTLNPNRSSIFYGGERLRRVAGL